LKLNQYYANDLNSEEKLLDQKAHGSLKNQHKDKTFLYFFSISVSKFFLMVKHFFSMSYALNCFCSWLKFKIKFLTATEKQPIVSSKQPIVLSLTAL